MSSRRHRWMRLVASGLLALAIALLAHAGGLASWSMRASSGPSARYLHAMCTDTDRQRIVLFGGSGTDVLDDTWEWDGQKWDRMNPPGARPVARCLHAMAYDEQHHVTILYGGLDDDDDPLDDTWSWDGQRWRLLSTHGPNLYGHAMAYDAARRRIVLFGGYEQNDDNPVEDETSDDTWLWNGSFWSKVSSDGPAGRWKHAMAYDALRQRVVLVGGEYINFDHGDSPYEVGEWDVRVLSDCWEWNGQHWALRSDEQLEPLRGHAMAWDPDAGMVIMFGGHNDYHFIRRTRNCSVPELTTLANDGPKARYGHAMAFDPVSRSVLVFGGKSTKRWKDTWGFDR